MSGNEFERFCLKQGQGLMAAVEGSTTLLKLLLTPPPPPTTLYITLFLFCFKTTVHLKGTLKSVLCTE